jgi:hypothetical protein
VFDVLGLSLRPAIDKGVGHEPNYHGDALMARGKSVRLLASIPKRYSPNFMERIDRRTVLGKAVFNLHAGLIEHLGGDSEVTIPLRSIVNRYTWSEMILQGIECRAASGEEVDVGSWTQLTNTQLGLARMLGLKRRPRLTETLRDIMRAGPDPEPDRGAEPVSEATAEQPA